MSARKPKPLDRSVSGRKRCPVCGMPSYSREGVHPQCAQTQADAIRVQKLKAAAKSAKKPASSKPAKSPLTLKAWHKRCPKCKEQVHIRKATCACGFAFGAKVR